MRQDANAGDSKGVAAPLRADGFRTTSGEKVRWLAASQWGLAGAQAGRIFQRFIIRPSSLIIAPRPFSPLPGRHQPITRDTLFPGYGRSIHQAPVAFTARRSWGVSRVSNPPAEQVSFGRTHLLVCERIPLKPPPCTGESTLNFFRDRPSSAIDAAPRADTLGRVSELSC